MMKRIGRCFQRDKSPLLEGLFTREPTHTHGHTVCNLTLKLLGPAAGVSGSLTVTVA